MKTVVKYTTNILYVLVLTVATLATSGCSDYIDIEDIEGKPIRLAATNAYVPTRAATDIQGPVFNEGAEVSVFIKGTTDEQTTPVNIDIDCPAVFTASAPKGSSGSKYNDLTPIGDTPHYLTGTGSAVSIIGTYPVITSSTFVQDTGDDYTFTVKDDQTSDDDYKVSDLMLTGVVSHVKNNETVNLPFDHKMAKLIISAIGEPGIIMDDEIVIGSTTGNQNGAGVYRSVMLDMSKADYKTPLDYSTNAGLSNRGQIKMTNGGAVLIPPQIVTTADFIIAKGHTSADPTTRECHFSITTKKFEAGKVYKLTLAISADNFTLPEAITGWTDNYGELTLMPSGGYAGVTIEEMATETYNGEAFTPKPVVWYGTDELTKIKLREGSTKDFVYNYVDNKNAGHAQVLVIGQNYYAGLAAVRGFTIKKRLGKISFPANSDRTGTDGDGIEFEQNLTLPAIKALNTAYDNSELKADGVVTYTAEDDEGNPTNVIAVDAVDGTVTIQNVGTAYVRATVPLGSPNTYDDGKNFFYTDGTQEGTTDTHTARYMVKVKAKDTNKTGTGALTVTYKTGNTTVVSGETKAVDQYFVYDGTAKSLASLTVSDGEYTLANGTDYTYTYLNTAGTGAPLHPGTYNLVITGKGNYSSSTSITIPIEVKQGKPVLSMTKDRKKKLWIGQYNASAPTDRRTTRPATTQYWAQNSLWYESENTAVATVNSTTGLITGVAPGETFIIVHVNADASSNHDYVAADTIKFPVKVVQADFEFKLQRQKVSGYEEPQLKRDANGVPIGAHTEWICPAKGNWQIDCYGAQGASTPNHRYENGTDGVYSAYPAKAAGGKGAHIAGRVDLPYHKHLFVNVGEQGRNIYTDATKSSTQVPHGYYELERFAWNGGGNVVWGGLVMMDAMGTAADRSDAPYNTDNFSGRTYSESDHHTHPRNVVQDVISGGGGATDISLSWGTYPTHEKMLNTNPRFFDWKSKEHLYSRVIVAGGGGGGIYYQYERGYGNGGDGGAWTGEDGKWFDYGQGGKMDRGGWGGFIQSWKVAPTNSNESWNTQTSRRQMIFYPDGPFCGGYSCTDGMFGEGGNYTQTRQGAGCGGGGWYGGGSGGEQSSNGSGGGGSSYMWSTITVTKSESRGNATVTMASLYDTIESDWDAYVTYLPSGQTSTGYWTLDTEAVRDAYKTNVLKIEYGKPYMPTTDPNHSVRKGHNNVIPYMTLVTADQGANPGDGWATIQLVQIDEDQ